MRFSPLSRRGQIQKHIETLEMRNYLSIGFNLTQFLNSTGFSNFTAAYDLRVADMNGDGKPDIIALGGGTSGSGIGVFINDGHGKFAAPIILNTPAQYSLAIGDYNGDGVQDIAVADQATDSISVFLGAGTNIGSASPSFLPAVTTTIPFPVTSGSLDFTEMQTANFGGTSDALIFGDDSTIYVIPSAGQGHLGSPVPIQNAPGVPIGESVPFVVADFNGDGNSDIAYAAGDGVDVQFGAAGPAFVVNVFNYPLPGPVDSMIAATLTPGGKPDLIVGNGESTLSVLKNIGGGSFASAVNLAGGDFLQLAAGDFDGNGSTDIAAEDIGTATFDVYLNDGAGTLSATTVDQGTTTATEIGQSGPNLIAADLNDDGKADIVNNSNFDVWINGATNSGGGGGGSGLTGALAGSAPSPVIAGQKAKIAQKLTVTASAAVSGSVTGALFLSSDGTVDSNSISLNSQTKKVKLKSGAKTSFNLKASSIPSSTANGTYSLIAQITDSNGTTDITGTSITVAPAQIDLSGSFSKQPVPGKNGKTTLSLSISNSGNTAASGLLKFNIDSSSTNTTAGATVITSPSKKINIKPAAKPQKISLPTTLPAGTYFLVIQLDPDNAFSDVNPANNIFATSSEITVG